MQQKIATVFGGSGFLGRYVVRQLTERGFSVRAASLRPDLAIALRPLGEVGQVVPVRAPVTKEDDVAAVVDGASVVINLVADKTAQARGAELVARLSAKAGVSRLIHMSVVGASSDGTSAYSRVRAAGERAAQKEFPAATIVRSSLLFGPEDRFLNLLGGLARYIPLFMPLYKGRTRVQPVYVADVAEGIACAATNPDCAGNTFEFGGPEVMTIEDVTKRVLQLTGRSRMLMPVPAMAAAVHAGILEKLPGPLLTSEYLNLIASDSVTSGDCPGLAQLSVRPVAADLIAPLYMERYVAGGEKAELARLRVSL